MTPELRAIFIRDMAALARLANEHQQFDIMANIIAQIDPLWDDRDAAMAFYRELEKRWSLPALDAEEGKHPAACGSKDDH